MSDKHGRAMNSNDPAIYTSPTRTYFVRTIRYPTPGGDYSVCLSSNTIENIDPTKRPQIMAALDSAAEDALIAELPEDQEPGAFTVAGSALEYIGDLPRT